MTFPTATGAPRAFGHQPAPNDHEREAANLETARRYLAAIEASSGGSGDSGGSGTESAESFFAPDVVQEEFPNRLVPAGARRDLTALREAAARGRGVMQRPRYEVGGAYAVGDTVILEVLWVGALAVPIGQLQPGQEMRAYFAMFLEFRDGRIRRQRNYDCFEPF